MQVTEVLNNPEAFRKFQAAQSELGSALSRLLVVSEQYPNLKANQASPTCASSWKVPRTASPWHATATSRPLSNTTCWRAVSQQRHRHGLQLFAQAGFHGGERGPDLGAPTVDFSKKQP